MKRNHFSSIHVGPIHGNYGFHQMSFSHLATTSTKQIHLELAVTLVDEVEPMTMEDLQLVLVPAQPRFGLAVLAREDDFRVLLVTLLVAQQLDETVLRLRTTHRQTDEI